MTTKTMKHLDKETLYHTWYYRYNGSPSLASLQKSIDAFQNEMFKLSEKADQLPLFKWSIGFDNKLKATIMKVVVSMVANKGGLIMTVTQPTTPVPQPTPHQPGDKRSFAAIVSPPVPPLPPPQPHSSDFEVMDQGKLGNVLFE